MTESQPQASQAPRQDLYSGRRIEWRWVGVGALIVLGLETLLGASAAAFGAELTTFVPFFVTTSVAFLVGGLMIGLLSPGWTIWEAGFASAIAVLWSGFLVARLLDAQFLSAVPLGLVWGILCGLAGAWVGERFQHRG